MENRSGFARALGKLKLSHVERAIALLWYYRQTQEFDERTASDLANDLHEEGFPKPNVTNLKSALTKSPFTVRGHRVGSFQLDVRALNDLDSKYTEVLKIKTVEVPNNILSSELVQGTRIYLEKLVYQINGTYEYGFYDACATLCRRLMESLIIEVYIFNSRVDEIQNGGFFFGLEKLISTIQADNKVTLGRNSPKIMKEIKQLGDTAAHDRVYVTQQQDIDDIKARYRRMISDLLTASGITK